MIRLRVLGGIELRREDGTAIEAVLRQPKRVALLTYLAAASGGVPRRREVVVSMFWPEMDDQHARDSLSAALTFLRRHLGPAAIAASGAEEIGCDSRHVAADVAEFLSAVEEHRDDEVLSLYHGDLLPGLHVQDAPGFEEWLERERARFRALAAASAASLTEHAAAKGTLEVAASYARRATELAPDDEKLLRRRISLEAGAGNRAAALRTYRDFAARLATAYDAEPSAETQALVAAIREHDVTLRVARAPDGDTLASPSLAHPAEPASPPLTDVPGGMTSPPLVMRPPHEGLARATKPLPARRRFLQPSLGTLSLSGIGLVAMLAMLAAVVRHSPLAARDELPLIVVADLSATDTVLGATAGAYLRSTLGRTPGVRTLGGEELAQALRRMRRDPMRPLDNAVARELAMREGASAVVSGRITKIESTQTILIDVVRDDGRVLLRSSTTSQSSAQLLSALATISERVRQSIGAGGHSRAALPPVTTSSLEALIAYTEGDRLRYNALDPRAAVPYYERAIELDSSFAMAYSQLGGAWNELGSAAPSPDTVMKVWRTAIRFADGLAPRELLAIQDRMIFAGPGDPATKFDEAVRLYQKYIRLHADDGPALQNLSWYLKHIGRWADSEAPALDAIRMGYAVPGVYDELVLAQIAGGKFQDAERSVRTWRERFGPSELWYRDAFRLAAARRDYAATDSLTAEATRDRTWNVRPGRLPILTLAIRGRLREAEALHTKAMATLEQGSNYGALIRETSWFAAIRAGVTGDTAGSLAMLHEVLRQHPPASLSPSAATHVYKDVGRHLALLGDTSGARAMLASLQSNWYVYRWDYNLRGLIHLAAGRPQEAIRELSEVRFSSGHLPSLGRAYEAMGASDSAIAVYERFLVQPDPDSPAWDAVFLVHVLERLGDLYASKGDSRLAAARYRLAAEVLREADPELEWRARRARDRAARVNTTK